MEEHDTAYKAASRYEPLQWQPPSNWSNYPLQLVEYQHPLATP